jgi:exodeoxyribonuclease VII large subunit
MSADRQIFTLKQVVSSIRKTIEERYMQLYWVKAEIHKFNRFPSGHAFPEIVQRENDKIVAQITGTIWKQNFERINHQFIQVVKEPLKEGSNLLLQVKITFTELYGLSLQIVDIDPSFSLGEVQKQREETLKKLQQEGILNQNQSLSFPLLPKRIAIISADSSKGLSDFMDVLTTNEKGYSFFTFLFNAYVQGDQAVDSIIQTLERIKRVKHHFDLVVLVRGGGAEVGMTCYNHFDLCKAIATFPLPILTGIGHSTNLNVAELIAFRNAITPTKLAEFLLQIFREFDQEIKDSQKLIVQKSVDVLFNSNQQLNSTTLIFNQAVKHSISSSKQELNELSKMIRYLVSTELTKNQVEITQTKIQLKHFSQVILTSPQVQLERWNEKIRLSTAGLILSTKRLLDETEKYVHLLDPIHVLNRGFSITYKNGEVIKNNEKLEEGDEIETQFAHGKVRSIIASE